MLRSKAIIPDCLAPAMPATATRLGFGDGLAGAVSRDLPVETAINIITRRFLMP